MVCANGKQNNHIGNFCLGWRVPFEQTQLTERAYGDLFNRIIGTSIDEELLLAASRSWGRWRAPLNISHCSFHEERSEENCWFLSRCGAVLCNRWVQIALSNDPNHFRRSCTLENRTLSSSHVDASPVTQIKTGVWPGTGFEWQMVRTFSVRKFRLGILDYLSRNPVFLIKFPFGKN